MSENVYTQTTITEQNYLLEENERYTPTFGDQTHVLQTCAVSCNASVMNGPTGTLPDFTFDIRQSEDLFIGNGMVVRATVPLRMVTNSTSTDPVTSTNYVNTVFNNYADFSLKQYGLLNMIETIMVYMNGSPISNISNIAEQASIIFPYYSESQVDDFFEASIPDRFQKYEQYDGSVDGITTIQPYSTRTKVQLSVPTGEHEENIFRSGYNKTYNTRKPVIEFGSYDSATKVFTGKIVLETFLPFSIFGLSESSSSFWGLFNFQLNVKLKSDPTAHLFSMKKRSDGVYPITRVEIDPDATNLQNTHLFYKVYSAPKFIRDEMRDKGTNAIKPYRIGTTHNQFNTVLTTTIGAHETKTVTVMESNISAIPKAIYIAAIRERTGGFTAISTTPNVFGRIEKIELAYENLGTNLAYDSACLYNICKGNGLTTDKESALYTAGFPVKLNFSSDISAGEDAFVGKLKSSNIRLNLEITNLDGTANHSYKVVTIVVYDSFIEYRDQSFTIIKALVTNANFNINNFAMTHLSKRMRRSNIVGGSFFKNLWNKIQSGAQNVAKFYGNNKDIIDGAVGLIRKSLGAGQLNNISGGAYSNISGGASMSGSNMLGAGKSVKNALAGKNVSSVNFL